MESDFLPRRARRQPQHPSSSFDAHRLRVRVHSAPAEQAAPEKPTTAPLVSDEIARTVQPIAHEAEQAATTEAPASTAPGATPPKRSFKDRLRALSKKQWLIIAVIIVLGIGLASFATYYFVLRDTTEPTVKVTKKAAVKKVPPKPVVYYSPLTGLQVDEATSKNPVTAVMIENSQTARPQAGIIEAGVVFEAVAEGGITRFITLFQDATPDYVGPVRSVRPYYIKWANGFDAPIAHVGGSAQALGMIRSPGGKDLDQFFNPSAYWRINSRPAPHNMYTSIAKLRELQTNKGWGSSTFSGFPRKAKEQPIATPTAKTIDFNISGAIYNSHYDYDAATNTYLRSEGGKPHLDDRSGQQINPKVVIGMVVPQGKDGIYTTYEAVGSGHVYIFQDGGVTEGTWEKTSLSSQITFKDASGKTIELNPGKTWISVVGSTDRVSYKP